MPIDYMNENIINFTQKILPKAILNNSLEDIDSLDSLNVFLKNEWNKSFEEKIDTFNFIHAIRKKQGSDKIGNINILIKLPYLNDGSTNKDLVTIIINTDITKKIRYFSLKELDEKILPITYAKANKKYLVIEIDENLEYINWGAVVNPRNLVNISESINIVKNKH